MDERDENIDGIKYRLQHVSQTLLLNIAPRNPAPQATASNMTQIFLVRENTKISVAANPQKQISHSNKSLISKRQLEFLAADIVQHIRRFP
jgi:hypothetical protein